MDGSSLLDFIQHSTRQLEQALDSAAQHWQISTGEVRILFFLSRSPHLDTARDVAARCGMSKASVSGNVLKLATRGLLTIDVDLTDRRYQHLTVTGQAEPILETVWQNVRQFCEAALSPLSPEERQAFLAAAARMARSLDDISCP